MTDRMSAEEYRREVEKSMSEHEIQKALFTWADAHKTQMPALRMLFAIPNGGDRNLVVAAKLKAEGVRAGVPDICLAVARGGYGALWIEMKKPGGRLRKKQKRWIRRLNDSGQKADVCYGLQEAIDTIIDYLDETE